MVISYKTVGGSSYTSWIDTSNGDTIEPWEPSYSAKPQIEELAQNFGQGSSVFTYTLGNIKCSLPLKSVCVTYASLDAALAASRTVPTTFLNNYIHLQVTQGTETQYFPYAVCTSFKCNVQGASVVYDVELTSRMVQSSAP